MMRQMGLSLVEMQASRAVEIITGLRKHENAAIATMAKELRAHWKEVRRDIIIIMLMTVVRDDLFYSLLRRC